MSQQRQDFCITVSVQHCFACHISLHREKSGPRKTRKRERHERGLCGANGTELVWGRKLSGWNRLMLELSHCSTTRHDLCIGAPAGACLQYNCATVPRFCVYYLSKKASGIGRALNWQILGVSTCFCVDSRRAQRRVSGGKPTGPRWAKPRRA